MQQISSQDRDPILAINENFRAVNPASLFGIDLSRSVGLVFAYYGGTIFNGVAYDTIVDGSIVLDPSEPAVFIEADADGNVTANNIGFTLGAVRLYVLATDAQGISSVTDYRVMLPEFNPNGGGGGGGSLETLSDVEIDTGLANGDVLSWDSVLGKWTNKPAGSGSGDVVGPASSTANRIAVFSDATGKLLSDSGILSTSIATVSSGVNTNLQNLSAMRLGTPFRKNLLLNGLLRHWRMGTSYTPASGDRLADMWKWYQSGTMAVTVTRSTNVPTYQEAGCVIPFSMQIDCDTADTSIAAGDYGYFSQRIEGYDTAPYSQYQAIWPGLTFQFWMMASKAGTYTVSIRNAATNQSFIATIGVSLTNTWEFKNISMNNAFSGTWDTTTGVGMEVSITLAAGTTFEGATTGWNNGNYIAHSSNPNANFFDSTANVMRVCGFQFARGNFWTDLEWVPFQQELARIERYLPIIQSESTSSGIGFGYSNSTTVGVISYPFKTKLRSTPTGIIVSGATDFSVVDAAGATATSGIAVGSASSREVAFLLLTVGSGLTAGQGCAGMFNTASGRLVFTGADL